MFTQLLKAAGDQPERKAYHDRRTERDDRALSAELNRQRHADQSHNEYRKWRGVLVLQGHGQRRSICAPSLQGRHIIPQSARVELRGTIYSRLESRGRIHAGDLQTVGSFACDRWLIEIDPLRFGNLKLISGEPLPFFAVDDTS